VRLGRRRSGDDGGGLTLFYASDVHGSDLLWRKFLGAGKFYDAAASIMGGDLLGKAIVPIEQRADGTYRLQFLGAEHVLAGADELDRMVEAIRMNGFYPWVGEPQEVAQATGDAAARDRLFDRVARSEIERWVKLAEERPSPDTRYVIAGNDDPWFVDEVLEASPGIVFCDERVVRVGEHEMLSCSYANPTPWNSPRELDEEALYARLRALADRLEDPATAIFNLHVPPYDSRLDRAVELDAEFRPRHRGGQPVEIPVGSRAVRRLIEECQPLLALHGHIHESRGEARIGRTLAINSGSEYNTGRLHGAVVTLGRDRVASHQFVVG
jgi:Icc-related predicted phosphoesterase